MSETNESTDDFDIYKMIRKANDPLVQAEALLRAGVEPGQLPLIQIRIGKIYVFPDED